jgi:ParB-like chromosome segregation protein Spo0J
VVAAADQPGRFLVIDGHKRIAALQQLGRTRSKPPSGL